MVQTVELLLIDDSPADANILRENLDEMDSLFCYMDWVQDFETGLTLALENKYHIYLVDYCLRGHTGLELIRRAIQGGCHRPMIIFSGFQDLGMGKEAVSYGASDYLVKNHMGLFTLEKSLVNALERGRILLERDQQHR